MTTSPDPYLLASTILTPEELPKLALVTYDPSAHHAHVNGTSTSNGAPPVHTQRIFVIVSNVSFGVEQSCVLVIKPRRKDPGTAALLGVIPILPDLQIEIEPQQGLTASAATPRNHPPAAATLGLSSLPQSLPAIHTLLESVVPDLFASDKADTSNAALTFTLRWGSQAASGVTSDARGLKDFLSVLKDLLKVAQEHAFSSDTTHTWMRAYTDELPSHHHHAHAAPQLETPIFSRFSHSAFVPSTHTPPAQPARPVSPTPNDIRISVGTFNVNGHLPPDDIPTLIGLKKWLRAEHDPDLIVLGFQEVDTSSGAYLYYSPAREDAWTRVITQALGRRATLYRKCAAKQLVGLLLLVFVRTELEPAVTEVAAASVGVGLGGFVANKGAVAVRMKVRERSLCFVNSHLSAFEGLQAMERRCWDWNEIYKRLRFRLAHSHMDDFWETPKGDVAEKGEDGGSDGASVATEHGANPFKTAQDVQEEASSERGGSEVQQQAAGSQGESPDSDAANGVESNLSALGGAPASDGTAPAADDDAQPDLTAAWRPSDSLDASTHAEHAIMSHDVVIHFGDLNFRLDLSHAEAHRLIRERQYALLHRYDQLESLRTSGTLLDDFDEGQISFAPTYKFDRGTDRYDTSDKQRVPAWTDRVLWAVTRDWDDTTSKDKMESGGERGGEGEDGGSATGEERADAEGTAEERLKQKRQGVLLQSYEAIPDIKFSDHRPVRATFLVRIR